MENERKLSQVENIKNHLRSGKGITPLAALNMYGCFRLAAVIFVLKNTHLMAIQTNIVNDGNKSYARYTLQS